MSGPTRPSTSIRPGRATARGAVAADRRAGIPAAALLVLALLLATGVATGWMYRMNQTADTQRFDALTQKLSDEIVRRMGVYAYGLMGTRSVFAASDHVDRDEFRRLVESRELSREFRAATAVGYIQRVAMDDLPDFVEVVRHDNAPGFTPRDLAPYETHDDHLIVKYCEPQPANVGVLGLDAGQEPRRRAAAETAMLTGEATLTAPITLALGGRDRAGFLLLLPDYQPDQPLETADQRRAALRGWVYMPLLAYRAFTDADQSVDGELDFEVFADADLSPTGLIFSDRNSSEDDGLAHAFVYADVDAGAEADADAVASACPAHAAHRTVVSIPIGGREWQIAVCPSDTFQAASRTPMVATAAGGTLLALLLAQMLLNQSNTLRRAQGIAQMMTLDLQHAAQTDRLTGLPNRSRIVETVEQALHRSRRVPGYHFAVLFLDFDRFKIINDTLGHDAGDQLLCEISRRLTETLRPNDAAAMGTRRKGLASIDVDDLDPTAPTAARLGGDEFIVLLDGLADSADAAGVAERLLQVLSDRYVIAGQDIVSTASIGVAIGHDGHASAEAVISDADTAMYEAKNAGKGTYRVFDQAMRDREQSRAALEQDLHLALERDEFLLEFQPIISLATGAVESCEALVRWNHPVHGRVGPDRFIPIAEANGVILPLGDWILDTALVHFAGWRRRPDFPDDTSISVNLSRKQLIQPDLVEKVIEATRRHGVPVDRLHLEVTESEVMSDPEVALANLRRLRAGGIQIDIDDFGTGHSSLACLHNFPIDVLKIDRAFIGNLDQDDALTAVLKTVTELARTLKFAVVAEGIETEPQLNVVRNLRCDFAQGYHFSRPLGSDQAAEYCIKAAEDAANAAPPLRLAA